jgi:hypothetical protein
MIIRTNITLPDGRAYELSLEPLFDLRGDFKDVRLLMSRSLPADKPSTEKQLTMGGELATAEGSFRLVDQ